MENFKFDFETMVRRIIEEEIDKRIAPLNGQPHEASPEPVQTESEYLTVDELSKLTGLKKATIYAKRTNRELPAYKFGRELRFKRDEIETWIRSKKQTCIPMTERRCR